MSFFNIVIFIFSILSITYITSTLEILKYNLGFFLSISNKYILGQRIYFCDLNNIKFVQIFFKKLSHMLSSIIILFRLKRQNMCSTLFEQSILYVTFGYVQAMFVKLVAQICISPQFLSLCICSKQENLVCVFWFLKQSIFSLQFSNYFLYVYICMQRERLFY